MDIFNGWVWLFCRYVLREGARKTFSERWVSVGEGEGKWSLVDNIVTELQKSNLIYGDRNSKTKKSDKKEQKKTKQNKTERK